MIKQQYYVRIANSYHIKSFRYMNIKNLGCVHTMKLQTLQTICLISRNLAQMLFPSQRRCFLKMHNFFVTLLLPEGSCSGRGGYSAVGCYLVIYPVIIVTLYKYSFFLFLELAAEINLIRCLLLKLLHCTPVSLLQYNHRLFTSYVVHRNFAL